MESSDIIAAVTTLEKRISKATKNAEQQCVAVTFELFTDGSCSLNFHWCSRSFKNSNASKEKMFDNLLADLNTNNETVQTFDNLSEFQRYLLDQEID